MQINKEMIMQETFATTTQTYLFNHLLAVFI
jgi:hypothetical protein